MKKIMISLLIILTACSTNQGHFTVLSNRLVMTDTFNSARAPKLEGLSGSDMSKVYFIFPNRVNSNLNGALNEVFNDTATDIMTDVDVTYSDWRIPFIYGEFGWQVKGDAYRTKR